MRLLGEPSPPESLSSTEQMARQLDALRQVASELVSETDLETLLGTIIRHSIALLAVDDGVFGMVQTGTRREENIFTIE